MADLIKIVIPKIQAEWEDVAFVLRYKVETVQAIQAKHNGDPKRCCRELLIDWLTTKLWCRPKDLVNTARKN